MENRVKSSPPVGVPGSAEQGHPSDTHTHTHPVQALELLAKKAKSKQQGIIGAPRSGVGYWLTPPDLYAELDAEFHFDYDACPYPCQPGFDGREVDWGRSTYVNPPFVGPGVSPTSWARKCREQADLGKTSVMIWPMDRWVVDAIAAGAELRPVRDFKWLDPAGRAAKPGRPHLLFVFRPRVLP